MVAVIVAVIVANSVAGPDRTLTGTATAVEAHRICVAQHGAATDCAHVDYPGLLDGLAPGDCVEVKRTGQGIVESVRRVDVCR